MSHHSNAHGNVEMPSIDTEPTLTRKSYISTQRVGWAFRLAVRVGTPLINDAAVIRGR